MLLSRIPLRRAAACSGLCVAAGRRAIASPSASLPRAWFSSASSPASRASWVVCRLHRPTPSSSLGSLESLGPLVLSRLSSAAARAPRQLPERLLIFHAGTARTTLIACLKVTTLFGFAFFTFLMGPAYLASGQPWWHVLGVVACGLVPFAVVVYTTAPFVVFVHLRLPVYARRPDRALLQRFVRNVPAGTRLDVTTMNLLGRPRVTSVPVADMRPAHERLRIVNFVNTRDTAAADAAAKADAKAAKAAIAGRLAHKPAGQGPATTAPQEQLVVFSRTFPWIHLRETTRFGAPVGNNSRGVKDAWAWNELMAMVERRTPQSPPSSQKST